MHPKTMMCKKPKIKKEYLFDKLNIILVRGSKNLYSTFYSLTILEQSLFWYPKSQQSYYPNNLMKRQDRDIKFDLFNI